jgi:membrane protein implicated in regulation of membrane protease activity
MSFFSSLIAWANAPFTVALGVAVLFAMLQVTGMLGLLAGGDDHDGDHDADTGHDVDGDHDADADGDHESEHADALHSLLGALGVGRVPLSILWQTYAIAFALTGLAMNAVYLGRHGALPLVTLAWTLPTAMVTGFVVTRALGRSLGRLLANPEQEATSRRQLVGQAGVVISSKVDGEFGEVRIRDKTGHVVRVICTTRESTPIPEGREVVVVEYDPARDHILVAPLDDERDARGRRAS